MFQSTVMHSRAQFSSNRRYSDLFPNIKGRGCFSGLDIGGVEPDSKVLGPQFSFHKSSQPTLPSQLPLHLASFPGASRSTCCASGNTKRDHQLPLTVKFPSFILFSLLPLSLHRPTMLALKRLSASRIAFVARGYSTSSGYASTAKNLLINADTKVIFQGLCICNLSGEKEEFGENEEKFAYVLCTGFTGKQGTYV